MAVILGGGTDFGRCPVATRLPRALWPVVGRSILECQLRWLWREGVRKVTVCAAGRLPLDRYGVDIAAPDGMEVKYVAERMPRGTAGSLRDAAAGATGTTIVLKTGIVRTGNLAALLEKHKAGGAVMTAFTVEAPGQGEMLLSPAGAYICEPEAVDAISAEGYEDIKEQLIPALLRKGLRVAAAPLGEVVEAGGDLEGYLALVDKALTEPERVGVELKGFERRSDGALAGQGAMIAESARLVGRVVVMPGAVVEKDAVVIGPAVIGRRAMVCAEAVLEGSVVWDGGFVGRGAYVGKSLVDTGAIVRPGRRVYGKSVGGDSKRANAVKTATAAVTGQRMSETKAPQTGAGFKVELHRETVHTLSEGPWQAYVLAAAAAVAVFLWAYSEVMSDLWNSWMTNDNYSSGVLVPLLAAYVIYNERKALAHVPVKPALWGIAVILFGFAMRLGGTVLMLSSVERFSVLAVVTGIVVTAFGMKMTWRLKWVLLFLALMFPWPMRIHNAVSLPLQNWATSSSVFMLQLLGWVVIREGNVLRLDDATVAVAEACSGLRMLTAFMTVSALVALVVKRSWWEKAIIVASSVPIAVLCNTIRLTATAIAFDANYGPQVNKWFHDFGGIAMMPLALGILAGEMWLFGKLAPQVETEAGER